MTDKFTPNIRKDNHAADLSHSVPITSDVHQPRTGNIAPNSAQVHGQRHLPAADRAKIGVKGE